MSYLRTSFIKCRYAECYYAECRCAECHYAMGRYAECSGTLFIDSLVNFHIFLVKSGFNESKLSTQLGLYSPNYL